MKKIFPIFLLLLFSSISAHAGIEITAKEAPNSIGQMVTVRDVVVNVVINQKGDAFVIFPGTLVGIVLHNFREEFDDINSFKGHEVEMTGVIVSHDGKPSIDIISGNQLKLASKKPQ